MFRRSRPDELWVGHVGKWNRQPFPWIADSHLESLTRNGRPVRVFLQQRTLEVNLGIGSEYKADNHRRCPCDAAPIAGRAPWLASQTKVVRRLPARTPRSSVGDAACFWPRAFEMGPNIGNPMPT